MSAKRRLPTVRTPDWSPVTRARNWSSPMRRPPFNGLLASSDATSGSARQPSPISTTDADAQCLSPECPSMTPIRRIAFIGNSLPRHCGIATFTTDLQQAVAAACPGVETCIVAMTDHGHEYDYRTAPVLMGLLWANIVSQMEAAIAYRILLPVGSFVPRQQRVIAQRLTVATVGRVCSTADKLYQIRFDFGVTGIEHIFR